MDKKTFQCDVESVGSFVFYHRTMREEMRIGVEYSRLTEGVEQPTRWLELFANMVAVINVLLHEAPAGWMLDELDPLDGDSFQQITAVYNALRSKEARFRGGDGAERKADGPRDGRLDYPVVSQTLQPASERSTVSELDPA